LKREESVVFMQGKEVEAAPLFPFQISKTFLNKILKIGHNNRFWILTNEQTCCIIKLKGGNSPFGFSFEN